MADETAAAAAAAAAVVRVAGQMEEVSGCHLCSPLECICWYPVCWPMRRDTLAAVELGRIFLVLYKY